MESGGLSLCEWNNIECDRSTLNEDDFHIFIQMPMNTKFCLFVCLFIANEKRCRINSFRSSLQPIPLPMDNFRGGEGPNRDIVWTVQACFTADCVFGHILSNRPSAHDQNTSNNKYWMRLNEIESDWSGIATLDLSLTYPLLRRESAGTNMFAQKI